MDTSETGRGMRGHNGIREGRSTGATGKPSSTHRWMAMRWNPSRTMRSEKNSYCLRRLLIWALNVKGEGIA
jgi:hypothetical protein